MSKEEKIDNKGLTVKKAENIVDWYSEVVQKAELADYAPIRGFMIIRPNAMQIWEAIQKDFNKTLEKWDVKNAYFPLLIPESFFKKEAEHAKGFAPELAYVDSKEEGERFAIRPTSETIMYDSYSKWIRSWRDLPFELNQWCNILRWEVKQTKPFLRTREFLWQEGHGVFETEKDAEKDMMRVIKAYKKLVEELLAIPVLMGKKSKGETFAGAKETQTVEAFMPDGKALQCGTSHNLGQGFAKVFDVKFQNREGKDSYGWQTSWGFSTRLIGAMIMQHGDDKGLIIPPKVAKTKVVIVPILFDKTRDKVLKKAKEIEKKLSKFGVIIDDREEYNPGYKFNEWELKGVPIRIEIGPKDLEKKQIIVVRRDTNEKSPIKEKDVAITIQKILGLIQKNLFEKAKEELYDRMDEAKNLAELKKKLDEKKIVQVYLCDEKEVEEKLKEKTGANSRLIQETQKQGVCVITGKKTKTRAFVASAY